MYRLNRLPTFGVLSREVESSRKKSTRVDSESNRTQPY